MKRKLIGLVAAVAASLVMATGVSAESAEPKYGGTLKYASHNTTATPGYSPDNSSSASLIFLDTAYEALAYC